MDRRTMLVSGLIATGAAAFASAGWAATASGSDRFSVVVKGAGPDVIFIPGLTSSRDVWNETVQRLGGKYRVHLIQLSGFAGEPSHGFKEGKVAAPVADDIATYIKKAGLKKPAVIGHSMGGTMGAMLAARHPDLVGKLMIVDMVPKLSSLWFGAALPPESVEAQAAKLRDATVSGPMEAVTANRVKSINSMVKTEARRPELLGHSNTSDRNVSGWAMYELLTTDLTPELKNITAPTTVLYPWDASLPYPQAAADAIYKAAYASRPDFKLARIDGSYHFIMVDQPDAFQREVGAFLKS